ncbi:hypothetical protein SAMN05446935_7340 [Burkholderia sp. YR290]|nr:hypothetical protein SAMN05446935_7340 [Burkholderia sp. YR290]
MQDEQRALLRFPELGSLAITLSGSGIPVELGCAQAGSAAGQRSTVLRVGGASGPVISEGREGVDLKRIWQGADADVESVASISTPALVVAYAEGSRANVPWALDIASELAVLMLSTPPPECIILHVAIPKVLTGRVPHIVGSESAARAFFLAGKVTLSPFRWNGSTYEFGVEQEQWAIAAVRALSSRLGGVSGVCDCCSGGDAAVYVSNYSERGMK